MNLKLIAVAIAGTLVATAAIADEIHNKTVTADRDIKEATQILHIMQAQHGPDFGGHFARAEALLHQADQEREAGMQYYRARHPGWQ